MNESQRASGPMRRESSDFSIEKILAKDASSTSTSSLVNTTNVFIVPEQTCTSVINPTVAIRSTSPAFVPRNKLDWLRNICKLQETKQLQSSSSNVNEIIVNSTESIKRSDDLNHGKFNSEELSWLRCTRYRPPKLPRKSCAGKNIKRKPGSHPRIPFTKHQLEVLEDKYKKNAYLSREDVQRLSDLLHLPQNRIKIWFQNRRARERRESHSIEQTHTTRIEL